MAVTPTDSRENGFDQSNSSSVSTTSTRCGRSGKRAGRGANIVVLPVIRQSGVGRSPVQFRSISRHDVPDGAKAEIGEQCPQALLGAVDVAVVANLPEAAARQPWLRRIDLPRVQIEYGRPRLLPVQSRDSP